MIDLEIFPLHCGTESLFLVMLLEEVREAGSLSLFSRFSQITHQPSNGSTQKVLCAL